MFSSIRQSIEKSQRLAELAEYQRNRIFWLLCEIGKAKGVISADAWAAKKDDRWDYYLMAMSDIAEAVRDENPVLAAAIYAAWSGIDAERQSSTTWLGLFYKNAKDCELARVRTKSAILFCVLSFYDGKGYPNQIGHDYDRLKSLCDSAANELTNILNKNK